MTRGSWMKFHCGDHVYDVDDERHVGRVESINWGTSATVRWENGWLSDVLLQNLRRAK